MLIKLNQSEQVFFSKKKIKKSHFFLPDMKLGTLIYSFEDCFLSVVPQKRKKKENQSNGSGDT